MKKNEIAKLILLGITTGVLVHSQPVEQEIDLEQDLLAYSSRDTMQIGCFPCNHCPGVSVDRDA